MDETQRARRGMSAFLYPGTYRDSAGEEAITLRNDGKTLSLRVRGTDFAGSDFDALELLGDAGEAAAAGFTLKQRRPADYQAVSSVYLPLVAPVPPL